jgi:peptidyl-prolyl cis-trans isomerase B (cyclophilin B)
MKRFVFLLYAALLGACWQPVVKDETSVRAVEIGELKRAVTAEMVADLDGAPELAARAALAIGRTKKPEGAPPLRAHLSAVDPSVRAMVVYGLGLLADADSIPDIRRATHDANSAVRYAALDALGRIYAVASAASLREDAANEILATGTSDPDPVVRGHALVQLDAFRKLSFAPAIAKQLQRSETDDRDRDVRWHAAWMLFRAYAKYADLTYLAHATHDPEELVRVETVRALGRRKEIAAIAIVRPLLNDPSWRVQFEAREALRRLTLVPATEHLKTMPAGIHLPAISAAPVPAPSVTYVDSPFVNSYGPAAAASPSQTLGPPDPASFPLGAPLLPRSASDLNGPAPGPHPRVLLHTTKGDVLIRMYPEWAPSTVANFLQLAAAGYFDGNRWFRIVPDFVVQTGDKTNTGDGDAGYMIPAEENPVEQRAGIIAMGLNYDAAGAERDSAGTQFYVNLSPQPHLDRAFSVFGEVASGFPVLAHLDESDRIITARRLCDD